ncbi:MAG TPA: thioredoxin family protein [Polyangiaceae bacterium]|nr:MAG: Thiol-disulfide oxidoreductase ResA [Deltaproteobacteria bacterium ADurb.Bin207]HNS99979.1 thioredoxin family protein [Polyangiaceae bacterium]HNZ23461.1 thioredoxin family protein [Polyangiaceae bacterium]HOD25667.1 thioredoxin family protein [Polyangiaceae bacterium]HOE51754.1 thioredoxin family protein [Polyangiaceae bacterium]
MAVTPSTMLPLGTRAPGFSLLNAVDGTRVALSDFREKRALLVMFVCNHCPYVVHVREELTRLGADYLPQGVGIVAINANSSKTHPQDGPSAMKQLAQQLGWQFPFLFDETQQVAKAYRAACTPDFFLFDDRTRLVYRGQLDDSRPGNGIAVTGKDLRAAIDALLAGRAVSDQQKPSIGCNIKWNAGNEPDYFG